MPREQHPLEIYGIQKIIDEGLEVKDISVKDLLFRILIELKIANIHNEIVTEEEVNSHDITG